MGPYPGKRSVDLAILVVVAPFGLVVGLLCALALKVTSGGPVLFRQVRIGLEGRPFTILKFRTMVVADDNPVFPDSTRVTAVGRWLRRLSLDELPQLLNVLRGEMSIVGPRPTLPYQVARYSEEQRRRLLVRPGITGLAQIGGRNRITWAERIALDLDYVRRQGVILDLRILLLTVAAIGRKDGTEGHPTTDPLAEVEEQVNRGESW